MTPMADGDLALRYRVPARQWEDAPPLGNGRLGAMASAGSRASACGSTTTVLDII